MALTLDTVVDYEIHEVFRGGKRLLIRDHMSDTEDAQRWIDKFASTTAYVSGPKSRYEIVEVTTSRKVV